MELIFENTKIIPELGDLVRTPGGHRIVVGEDSIGYCLVDVLTGEITSPIYKSLDDLTSEVNLLKIFRKADLLLTVSGEGIS